jgi:AraC-like DNA-binding protein
MLRSKKQTIFGVLHNSCKNEKITWILDYINSHLASPLSIDDLASRFFISRKHQ